MQDLKEIVEQAKSDSAVDIPRKWGGKITQLFKDYGLEVVLQHDSDRSPSIGMSVIRHGNRALLYLNSTAQGALSWGAWGHRPCFKIPESHLSVPAPLNTHIEQIDNKTAYAVPTIRYTEDEADATLRHELTHAINNDNELTQKFDVFAAPSCALTGIASYKKLRALTTQATGYKKSCRSCSWIWGLCFFIRFLSRAILLL